MFQSLYQGPCRDVAGQANTPSVFIGLVMERFKQFYRKHIRGEQTAANIHRDTLRKYTKQWKDLKSWRTCFVCLSRVPEKKHSCGHYICERCVTIFGMPDKYDPQRFVLEACLLCQSQSRLEIWVLPATAGVGILAIDGGGIRGVVPIMILRRQQEILKNSFGVDMPPQEAYHLVVGISSGTLASL